MPKKQELFCQLTYVRRNSTGVTHTLYFRIHDVTKSGILNWKMRVWGFSPCVFGVIHNGATDKLKEFKLTLLTNPHIGCDAMEGVVYTRELRISEKSFLNLNEDREWNIKTQEGPRIMYSQGYDHWARDFFNKFLEIEK